MALLDVWMLQHRENISKDHVLAYPPTWMLPIRKQAGSLHVGHHFFKMPAEKHSRSKEAAHNTGDGGGAVAPNMRPSGWASLLCNSPQFSNRLLLPLSVHFARAIEIEGTRRCVRDTSHRRRRELLKMSPRRERFGLDEVCRFEIAWLAWATGELLQVL